MKLFSVKKVRFLPSVVVSVFLLALTLGTTKVEANTSNTQAQNPVQLAWWGGWGWHHGWNNGWNNGWHRGWGGNYGGDCRCWINRWGHERCNCD
jgi:hypothetical protein